MLKLKINMDKKVVIVGAGVAGVNAATKLVDNGYPGELITIIDMGKSPYERNTRRGNDWLFRCRWLE
jgi:cation diffusion facilitator CzcD-associated flavoprotein CzcO